DDRDLDDVIEDIVDRMILMGYLTPENNDVLITVKDGKASAELLAQTNAQVASYLEYRKLDTTVRSQLVAMDEELVRTAEALNISPGKMAIIDALVQ
ncbi:MAG: hypothetical protein Q4B48_08805, partial [Syntrophomonadaceae bacterium]|nr:hypothetical protein [Syntrophomonadaceae bacterium]